MTNTAPFLPAQKETMTQIDKKLTILIADDSPDDQFIFQIAINEVAPNAEIIFVYNGLQLVDYFSSTGGEKSPRFKMPDVIIADLNMPFHSAFEALHKIKINACLNVPAYVFSGLVTNDQTNQAKVYGVDGIFRKPTTITELKSLLRGILVKV
jgi:CheY-like chemotaxis protein